MAPSELLTADQAADRLGIRRQTFFNYVQRDAAFPKPKDKVGRTPLWDPAELDAWRAEHPARAKATKPAGAATARDGKRKRLTERQARVIVDEATLEKAPDWPQSHAWHSTAEDGTILVVVVPSYGGASASGRNGWTYYLPEIGPGGKPGPYKTRESAAVQGLMAWIRWATHTA